MRPYSDRAFVSDLPGDWSPPKTSARLTELSDDLERANQAYFEQLRVIEALNRTEHTMKRGKFLNRKIDAVCKASHLKDESRRCLLKIAAFLHRSHPLQARIAWALRQ